jgi:hypothetical protein
MTRNEVEFNTIDLNKFCCEKTFEIFEINHQHDKNGCMLHTQVSNQKFGPVLYIIGGYFKKSVSAYPHLSTCGDFSINFLTEN